jgi:hypothetical protein
VEIALRVREQQQIGDVRVRHERDVGMADREEGVAGGHAREPLLRERVVAELGEERRAHRRRRDDGLGERRAAALLEEEHAERLVEAHAAVRVGHECAREPDVGQLLPEVGRAPGLGPPRRAHALGRALRAQEVAHGLLEQQRVLAEAEVHRQSLGMPRMRSAITLRWISFVPA